MTDRVLIVDDDSHASELLRPLLSAKGLSVLWTRDLEEGLALAAESSTRVLVAALCSRPHPGEALATEARRRSPDLPIILLGGSEALESVSSGLRSLSHALIEKPLRGRELLDAVFQAARGRGLAEASHRPARARSESFGNLVGDSPAMREVYALIERVATSDLPVLVTGESGTGKELVAKELHRRGARASGPFVAVNCAALP
jgi:two-component system response regulator HydG